MEDNKKHKKQTKSTYKKRPKKLAKSSTQPVLKDTGSNPLWGGRFSKGPSSIMEDINSSVDVDWVLYEEDIECSKAHAEMLYNQGILNNSDKKKIIKGLNQIQREIEDGELTPNHTLEDIHMNIENRLFLLIGDAAGRLHTARSRNDQVATDFKIWIRKAIDQSDRELQALQGALIKRAEEHSDTPIPGFTHLQGAQPVTLGHHLLSYVEMFGRDRGRFNDARKRLNECPLGSAALAGTSFPIDRKMTSESLGFDRPTRNSLDSVSDRDFALEALAAVALCSSHLSRLGEELVIWSSNQFGFIRLSDSFSTGSSIMPQKRNPDAAELIRGKNGRVTGNFVGLLNTMKGLSLAYAKDMQEDKEPIFDSFKTLSICLRAAGGMINDMTINKEAMAEATKEGHSTATELADWLVRELNIPFRNAHESVGKIVKMADSKDSRLWDLSLSDLQSIQPKITKTARDILKPEIAINTKTSYGGTSVKQVKLQLRHAKKRFL